MSQVALADEASHANASQAVLECLRDGAVEAVRRFLDEHEPADTALLLARLDPPDAFAAMRTVKPRDQALIFGYLPTERQVAIAGLISRRDLASIMAAMSHDERADLFKNLEESAREALLPGLAQAERDDLLDLAAYPEGSVGAVMTSDYATLEWNARIGEAIEALRLQAPDSETIYQAYIVDAQRRLIGSLSLRELLLARPNECVSDLMDRDPVHLQAQAPRGAAASLISRYDLIAVPVVDVGGKLVGIITYDDAMDVQEEEATEDFHRVGTVQRLTGSVRAASILKLYRARILWLVLLVFGNIFSGLGIAAYEDTIAAYVALVFFLPLLIGSGGNAGSQSSTLMVRALATGDVRSSDWAAMLARELVVAALLGLTMAAAVSVIGVVRGGPGIAVVVALSMMLIVVVGSMIGMSLPFLLSRFKLDPATASAPLVTSIADAAGVLIYFGIATRVLAT